MNPAYDRCDGRAFWRWLAIRSSGHRGLDEIDQLLITAPSRGEPFVAQRKHRDEQGFQQRGLHREGTQIRMQGIVQLIPPISGWVDRPHKDLKSLGTRRIKQGNQTRFASPEMFVESASRDPGQGDDIRHGGTCKPMARHRLRHGVEQTMAVVAFRFLKRSWLHDPNGT